ncbi:MAG TPA: CPBP family intramembrane glutamic endopeptidase, partial [Candidatus Dormibacteraeota bacterium]|nr:CPBP family intramembrane glutamic endopeptidase [Candidatus Dormibacteraeota bacterium]
SRPQGRTVTTVRPWIRSHLIAAAVIGTLLAIAVSAVMDVVGLSGINVFPLVPLFFLYWYLLRLSRPAIGFVWGHLRDYGLALLYPALVLSLVGLLAWLSGAVSVAAVDWHQTLFDLIVKQFLPTLIFALITEEGIFRGWLWATLSRAGVTALRLVLLTSVAFAAWHVPDVILPTGFQPSPAQAPVLILNAGVIGASWAIMRLRSGSIVVTSLSHSVWNALVYVLFGVGSTVGALGIHNTTVFGPEIGLVGLGLNLAFATVLWVTLGRRSDGLEPAAP